MAYGRDIWQESPHKKMPRSNHCGNRGKVEAESPPWRNNLDATKNYGYPAREAGATARIRRMTVSTVNPNREDWATAVIAS